jgi:SRSO17 transposase
MPSMGDTGKSHRSTVPDHPAIGKNQEPVLNELCAVLFATLSRVDQRRKGMKYVRGLLGTPGRKSMRNIAALFGGKTTEQSLHHFISDSTWDWTPVRQALTGYVTRAAPPQAWVVRPMVIPKAGEHSVGVGKRYDPTLGQALNAQQAIGVWAASDRLSVPVNWRLHLSESWLDDGDRRTRASIPDGLGLESLGDCVVEAYRELARVPWLPVRPLVLDGRQMCALTILRKLSAAGVPVLVRIKGAVRLSAIDPFVPVRSGAPVPAHYLLEAARALRRPVPAPRHDTGRSHLAAAVGVRVPVPHHEDGIGERDMVLLGVGRGGHGWPAETWLTDLTDTPVHTLVRLTRLVQRVDRDFTEIADRVGIRDFAGRSFTGWHRHVTLASAAHAVVALSRATEPDPAPPVTGVQDGQRDRVIVHSGR